LTPKWGSYFGPHFGATRNENEKAETKTGPHNGPQTGATADTARRHFEAAMWPRTWSRILDPIWGPWFGRKHLCYISLLASFRSKNGPHIGTRNINRKHSSRAQFAWVLHRIRSRKPGGPTYKWAFTGLGQLRGDKLIGGNGPRA